MGLFITVFERIKVSNLQRKQNRGGFLSRSEADSSRHEKCSSSSSCCCSIFSPASHMPKNPTVYYGTWVSKTKDAGTYGQGSKGQKPTPYGPTLRPKNNHFQIIFYSSSTLRQNIYVIFDKIVAKRAQMEQKGEKNLTLTGTEIFPFYLLPFLLPLSPQNFYPSPKAFFGVSLRHSFPH